MTAQEEAILVDVLTEMFKEGLSLLANAKSGKVDPNAAIAGASSLRDQLAANNAAADSALDARFPK